MKIAGISDTHGMLEEASIPKVDVLVCAGDILPNYDNNYRRDAFKQFEGLNLLNDYFRQLKNDEICKKIIFVPGNHERVGTVFALHQMQDQLNEAHILIDKAISIEDVHFYGSPWTPWFYGDRWAYNFPAADKPDCEHAENCWNMIPEETNVVVTHGPPYNILDESLEGTLCGCPKLADRLNALGKKGNLKLSLFGHIHEGYGQTKINDVIYANVSLCNRFYKPVNPIQVFEI